VTEETQDKRLEEQIKAAIARVGSPEVRLAAVQARLREIEAERDELRAEVEKSRAESLSGYPPYYRLWLESQARLSECVAEVEHLKANNRYQAGYAAGERAGREAREKVEAALREMHALIPAVMDALESDAQLDVRRAAFESIQEAYEESHPWGAAILADKGHP
jgi:flagellar biosynthesis/type III secretory pathway protein FliH